MEDEADKSGKVEPVYYYDDDRYFWRTMLVIGLLTLASVIVLILVKHGK